MANEALKATLKRYHVSYWQLAEVFDVHENTIMRKLRKELSKADKACFEKAVKTIIISRNKKPSECCEHPDGGQAY